VNVWVEGVVMHAKASSRDDLVSTCSKAQPVEPRASRLILHLFAPPRIDGQFTSMDGDEGDERRSECTRRAVQVASDAGTSREADRATTAAAPPPVGRCAWPARARIQNGFDASAEARRLRCVRFLGGRRNFCQAGFSNGALQAENVDSGHGD